MGSCRDAMEALFVLNKFEFIVYLKYLGVECFKSMSHTTKDS